MGVIRWIGEQRERQIVAYAAAHLEEGECVTDWTRTRNPEARRRQEGFAYLTPHRTVVHWTGRKDGDLTLSFKDISSWGVSSQTKGGPVLAMESDGKVISIQLVVRTPAMALEVSGFLRKFAELVPEPHRALSRKSGWDGFRADPHIRVGPDKQSVVERTRRVLATVLGVFLVLTGVVVGLVPGPGGILLVIAGLAVLGTEYDWAKDVLAWVRYKYRQAAARLRARRSTD